MLSINLRTIFLLLLLNTMIKARRHKHHGKRRHHHHHHRGWLNRANHHYQSRQTGFYPNNAQYQTKQTGFYPESNKYQPRQTGFYPKINQLPSKQTGFYPERNKYQPRQTGFYPKINQLQTKQTGFYPERNKYQPRQTGFYPKINQLQTKQTGFYPESNKYQPRQTSFYTNSSKYQPRQTGFYPKSNQYQTKETGFYPENNKYQPRQTSFYPKSNQYQPQQTGFYANSNQYQTKQTGLYPDNKEHQTRQTGLNSSSKQYPTQSSDFSSENEYNTTAYDNKQYQTRQTGLNSSSKQYPTQPSGFSSENEYNTTAYDNKPYQTRHTGYHHPLTQPTNLSGNDEYQTANNRINVMKSHPVNKQSKTTNDYKNDDSTSCLDEAKKTNDDDTKDLAFFKKCITGHYGFQKSPSGDSFSTVPTFYKVIGTPLFNAIAKRVELFFVRKNLWSQTVADVKGCGKLLDVIAARHLYILYVLNILQETQTFERCAPGPAGSGKLYVRPTGGSCFLPVKPPVTCYSDFDISLSGAKSGQLTALFNQFFREPVGGDPIIPGVAKSPEELFNANVHAFALENALPNIFAGLSTDLENQITALNENAKNKVEEVVSAVYKMKKYNSVYHNELLNDGGTDFINWNAELQKFHDAVNGLKSSDAYTNTIGFRYQQEIAFQMASGVIEASGKTGLAAKVLAQNAIALMFASEAYHTRGSIRHVIGTGLQALLLKAPPQKYTRTDYWVSMLENWADSVKEYNRECPNKGYIVCIIKMSKYLYRTLDAMNEIWSTLTGAQKKDLVHTTPAKNLMFYIVQNVKQKGVSKLPGGKKNELYNKFLKVFGCAQHKAGQALTQACMDAINNEIRKYVRQLAKL